jgi:hypothetical protein
MSRSTTGREHVRDPHGTMCVMRWRRKTSFRAAAQVEELVQVACAYCDEGVEYTDRDPIALGIVERWRPYEEQPDHTVYAHRECFMRTLHPEVSETVGEWEPPGGW